ncbi:MAG TPA: 50S ribosomal protein L25/general stress protein Ctc [Gammaproteobacteria bacterium]|jgi:large subunit ribosomal protein L25|nr:50S ribosomal protein L25/general stress protein Ctc [Gammaproteobacteria bacterium]
MAENIDLIAELRDDSGTSSSRRSRRSGMVPAIIYGGGKESIKLNIGHDQLLYKLSVPAFVTSILNIKVEDKEEPVFIKDIQIHPSKKQIIHLDFQRVIADQAIRLTVPIHFIGEDLSDGVQLEGGTITPLLNEIEVSCLPKDLPEYLEVSVEGLKLDELLFLSDIALPEGVEIPQLTQEEPNNEPIVAIRILIIQEEEPEEVIEEGEEGEEGTETEQDEALAKTTTDSEEDTDKSDSEDHKNNS